jgi:uncharacterized protein
MDYHQVNKLMSNGTFPDKSHKPMLKETHISWVILRSKYAYKIKKPVQYSFLDFSTLEKRKYYCEREVELNKRLASKMYLKAMPVFLDDETFSLVEGNSIIDYAVMMNKMDSSKEMRAMLERNSVSDTTIEKLAKRIAAFHLNAAVVKNKFDIDNMREKYNDLSSVKEFISEHCDSSFADIINRAIQRSDTFLNSKRNYFQERSSQGMIRDVHGDLHSGNIFLYEDPVIFDCIEFNDDFRHIDVLDEIAFFCMDLEAYNRADLSRLFYDNYFLHSKMKETGESKTLFNYYKSYRANVRAKTNALNAMASVDDEVRLEMKMETEKYLKLLESYSIKISI